MYQPISNLPTYSAAIFRTLGLDPDRSYAENLRIFKGAT